jgi:sugar phosphate isomerase/epimerase
MRLRHPDGTLLHLAYCSNVHPAEDLDGVVGQLERYAGAIRERLEVPTLGVGLWLGWHVVDNNGAAAKRLAQELRRLRLEVVTLNGFPYEAFHAPVVKRAVYRPSWADPRRRYYTLGLARVLAELLPDDVEEGSISTLPLGWREEWNEAAGAAARAALEQVADGLHRLEAETGRRIRLALEPEPGCEIESVAQASDFLAGLAPDRIGICLDACHLAVQFEQADGALAELADRRVPVVKAQISSALRVERPGSTEARALLDGFTEPRFLHQVRERVNGRVAGVDDLPDALRGGLPADGEWRVHFHVPVHTAEHTTQAELEATLAALVGGAAPATRHLEVETYTWSVLPEGAGDAGTDRAGAEDRLIDGIASELAWTRDRLVALGAEPLD